eukprot:CAMPEP_0184497736 /NCGR_PEP_ID=MMETSP0113_2-20130426/37303_1 /TAXON_ID=91329 /ORGANISM="Norrisiella sphaerica, Strain BC52" /LENGTH=285 /DNA_ID=CAMNT_0026884973 /DNA_START=936 /DNA_END=1790 /DNA_ORIENTATION=-
MATYLLDLISGCDNHFIISGMLSLIRMDSSINLILLFLCWPLVLYYQLALRILGILKEKPIWKEEKQADANNKHRVYKATASACSSGALALKSGAEHFQTNSKGELHIIVNDSDASRQHQNLAKRPSSPAIAYNATGIGTFSKQKVSKPRRGLPRWGTRHSLPKNAISSKHVICAEGSASGDLLIPQPVPVGVRSCQESKRKEALNLSLFRGAKGGGAGGVANKRRSLELKMGEREKQKSLEAQVTKLPLQSRLQQYRNACVVESAAPGGAGGETLGKDGKERRE